jgi:hypothetical protein
MIRLVKVGEAFLHLMPYSEVCIHMRVASKPMLVEIISDRAAQLHEPAAAPDQKPRMFSAPILLGEAGAYTDSFGRHYIHETKD